MMTNDAVEKLRTRFTGTKKALQMTGENARTDIGPKNVRKKKESEKKREKKKEKRAI